MDAKVKSNLSQHFDITEPADINPVDFAVLQTGKSLLDPLHSFLLNGVGIILDQQYFWLLAFLVRRCDESCRWRPRLTIAKHVHRHGPFQSAASKHARRWPTHPRRPKDRIQRIPERIN